MGYYVGVKEYQTTQTVSNFSMQFFSWEKPWREEVVWMLTEDEEKFTEKQRKALQRLCLMYKRIGFTYMRKNVKMLLVYVHEQINGGKENEFKMVSAVC